MEFRLANTISRANVTPINLFLISVTKSFHHQFLLLLSIFQSIACVASEIVILREQSFGRGAAAAKQCAKTIFNLANGLF